MPKLSKEFDLLPLLHKFINEIKKGKHLQKNGKRIKPSSIRNYYSLQLLLISFSHKHNFKLRFKIVTAFSKKQFNDEKKYWKDFYHAFTSHLYDDLKHHDNYVGRVIKLLRSFFNFLITEKGMDIGFFHRKFYAPSEETDILVVSPERLNYLIDHTALEDSLTDELKKVKDIFVFGCSVALRYSDLMALTKVNLEIINQRMYIKIRSKKTQTFTRVKLPPFAVDIINKYSGLYTEKLLPTYNKVYLNKKIKKVMEHYGFTETIVRTRQRRGIPENIFKNKQTKTPLRFCDAITTHTMRRSAITSMLSLGMGEHVVRQISGHAANSKEFFRYVSFAQTYIDTEIDTMHEKLIQKKMEILA